MSGKIIISAAKKLPIKGIQYSNMEGAATIELDVKTPEEFETQLQEASSRLYAALESSMGVVNGVGTDATEASDNTNAKLKKNLAALMEFIKKQGLNAEFAEFVKNYVK